MEHPFTDDQHAVLSRSFTAVNDAINNLNSNLKRVIFSMNIHGLILGIIIAVLICSGEYSGITKIILWGLLCIDISYVIIFPWRSDE